MDEKSQLFNQLVDFLVSSKSKSEMRGALFGLLTHKELEEIPMRLEIVRLLRANIPHHEIAKKLGVGVATVTRGSKELHKGHLKIYSWRPARSAGKTSYN